MTQQSPAPNRRQLLAATAVALAARATNRGRPAAAAAAEAAAERPAAPPDRRPPFRVLYSNDTTNITTCVSPFHRRGEPFRPGMLEATVDEVAGRGVDAHLLQPGVGWVPWWPSKVYPAAEHYAWVEATFGVKPDPFGRYLLAGGDLVQVFVDRCRKTGQAPFVSLRLNDGHHKEWARYRKGDPVPPDKAAGGKGLAGKVPGGVAQGLSKFYVEHPEYRIGPDPADWMQRVQNWLVPEVRAHKLAFVRELCEGYDLDGFELDFLRHHSFFQLDKTTPAERSAVMTGFVKDVRAVLDGTARGGRRRWLSVRVPCYLPALAALGLDPPALAAVGADLFNVSASYFAVQQSDLSAIRRSVPDAFVYQELCHSVWNGRRLAAGNDAFDFRRTTPEQYRTAAHLAYVGAGGAAGDVGGAGDARGAVDGVSLFNFAYYREFGDPTNRGPFHEPPFDVIASLGQPPAVAAGPQHYFLAPGWKQPFTKALDLPRNVSAGQAAAFDLTLAPPTGGWRRGGRLRIQGEATLGDGAWSATLNGIALAASSDVAEPYPSPYRGLIGKPDELRAWAVPAAVPRAGANRLELTLTSGAKARVAYVDLALT
jgi:hypothetical protein